MKTRPQRKKPVVPPKMTTRSRDCTIKPSRFADEEDYLIDEAEESEDGNLKSNMPRKVPRKTKDPSFKPKASRGGRKAGRKRSMDSGDSVGGVRK